jgi:sulfate adenylyltransferase
MSKTQPHGGALRQLLEDPQSAELIKEESQDYPSLTLTRRQLCDLELLINGGFSPLDGFMNQADYVSVIEKMCLSDGTLWPIPITLSISTQQASALKVGDRLALRDGEGFMLAALEVDDIWQPDKHREAKLVYGTDSELHPGVDQLFNHNGECYIGGRVLGVELPEHYEFNQLWKTPAELRRQFNQLGWRRIIAYQTTAPIHRRHRDVLLEKARERQAHLLLHPNAGVAKPGDLHHNARIECYQSVVSYFPKNLTSLALLPLAMRMAGPREALLHAIIHQNYGCSDFIIGPDYASPPQDRTNGERCYPTYAAQELFEQYGNRLNIAMVSVEKQYYAPRAQRYLPESEIVEQKLDYTPYAEHDLKQNLLLNARIPEWYSFPKVIEALRKAYPPREKIGFTLFFTGLSGAGKSTLAKIIHAKLVEEGSRPVTLLDGDIVRLNLSSELGFSREHRNLNIRRIGFVANEICKNGGVAICAPIAPYSTTRKQVREMIEEHGAFIEIHVATSLEVCEHRDRKGLYAKARRGEIKEFTGISDPYEEPIQPELKIDTAKYSPMEAVQKIYLYLFKHGYIGKSQ